MRSAQLTAFNNVSIGDMPMNCIFLLEPKTCSDIIRGLSIAEVMKENRKKGERQRREKQNLLLYLLVREWT